jgi:Secretion system C-terminal sorting domain
MKRNLQTIFSLFLIAFLLGHGTTTVSAQVLGDYQSVATGDWLTAATWQRYDGAAWQTTASAPSITSNVTIKAGHVVSLTSTTATPSARNLTIEAGSTVNGTGTLRIYGPILRVDGTLAYTAGATALFLEAATAAADGTTLTITGTGSEIQVNRLRPNIAGLTIIIDANIYINPVQASGGAAIGANGKEGTTFTINAGKTARAAPLGYLSCGASGSGDPVTNATWTINVNGTLNVGTDVNGQAGTGIPPGTSVTVPSATNFNLRNGAGKTSTLNVSSTGIINIAGNLLAPDGSAPLSTATAGTPIVNVAAGGLINFVGFGTTPFTGGQCDISKATTTIAGTIDLNNSLTTPRSLGTANITGRVRLKDGTFPSGAITLGAGSTVEYYGAATISATPTVYNNLEINSSAGSCTLSAPITVNGQMTMTVGKLILGANDLTLNGALVGASGANKYFVTNGLGALIRNNISASTIMQVGVSETSYDPFSVTPSGTCSFKARVGATFTYPIINAARLIQREWTVEKTAGSGASAVTFQHDATAPLNSFSAGLGKIIGRWNGMIWEELSPIYGFPLPANTFGILSSITAFGTFVVGNVGAVIPVELINFKGYAKGNANQLEWSTASERNNAEFAIERSTDGVDFTKIGSVKGNGTTNSVSNYSFSDFEGPLSINGLNYYRLRQIDFNGNATTSKVLTITRDKKAQEGILKTYPSVTDAVLNVDFNANTDVTFKVIDVLGRLVLTKTVQNNNGSNSTQIDVSALTNGMYILSFETATTKRVEKFEKR